MKNTNKKIREVVLCIKATGYKPEEGDRIEEVACIELINGRETGKKFHSFINIEGRQLDESTCDVSKIGKRAMKAFEDGKHFHEIEKELMHFIQPNKNHKANLVIFNKPYVLHHLEYAMPSFDRNKSVNIEDVLHTAQMKTPDEKSHTFDTLLKKLHITNPRRTHYSAKQDAAFLVKIHAQLSDEKLHTSYTTSISMFSSTNQAKATPTNDTPAMPLDTVRANKI